MLSSTWANRLIFVLALAGVVVALALTLKHVAAVDLPCGPLGGCDRVAQHPTAFGFGIPALRAIPTAAFGLAGYVVLAALSMARVLVTRPADRLLSAAVLVMTLGGTGIAGWLTYVEATVIKAYCTWCVASAAIMFLMLVCALLERMPRPEQAQGEAL